jgi:hypothetical protein
MRFARYSTVAAAAVTLLLGSSVFAVSAFAQGSPQSSGSSSAPSAGTGSAPSGGGDMESQKQLDIAAARAQRKAVVGQNMYLSADQGKVFWPLYDQYEAAMDKIEDRHIKEIKAYVKSYRTLTNDDATRKLDEVLKIQQARLNVQKAFVPKFRAVLPSIMVTRFYQIDNKLNALVQCDIAQMVPLAQPTGAPDTAKSY